MIRNVINNRTGSIVARQWSLVTYRYATPILTLGTLNQITRLTHRQKNVSLQPRRLIHSNTPLWNANKESKTVPSVKTSNTSASAKTEQPQLMIAFTCKKCNTRSSHTMSKQAYTKGTVLIQCPGCKNRHLIADHLKIFNDDNINIEDILKAKGESVSQSTDDLVFEDIPEKLKPILSKYIGDGKNNKHNCDGHDH